MLIPGWLKPAHPSSPQKSAKQEEFEREARETLENADMGKFDQMMKRLVQTGRDAKGQKRKP
jgi:hypothetical protein